MNKERGENGVRAHCRVLNGEKTFKNHSMRSSAVKSVNI